jgi:hypothetical protein
MKVSNSIRAKTSTACSDITHNMTLYKKKMNKKSAHKAALKQNKFTRLREALFHGLPVNDVPDGAEVLGLAVLVLEADIALASVH